MRRVLIVNDEEKVRLETHGYDVDVATDGADAIARLSKGTYDAVVLDVVMQGVNGLGVLIHLARTNPTMIGRTVLVASALQEALEAQLEEVCRVLVKPLADGMLIEAVEECSAA